GRLGKIASVTREDTPALSREVPLDLAAIQAAWPAFESGFDSLKGRRMMSLIDNRAATYRLCCERLPRDAEDSLRPDDTTIPGGTRRPSQAGAPCDSGSEGTLPVSTTRSRRRSTSSSNTPSMIPRVRSSSSIDAKAKSTAFCRSKAAGPLTEHC